MHTDMTHKTIKRDDFTAPRTPPELAAYVRATYESIASVRELRQTARMHPEPYKTFLEELMPFSHFCSWRYGNRSDVLCSLVAGTPGRDAIVVSRDSAIEHSVEITWPIDGRRTINQARQINDRGHTEFDIWGHDDTTKQRAAVDRILETARKKSLRDYRAEGGSTIIFVMDRSNFWDSNPAHVKLLDSLRRELAAVPLLSESCLLMLVMGHERTIIELKGTEQTHAGETSETAPSADSEASDA